MEETNIFSGKIQVIRKRNLLPGFLYLVLTSYRTMRHKKAHTSIKIMDPYWDLCCSIYDLKTGINSLQIKQDYSKKFHLKLILRVAERSCNLIKWQMKIDVYKCQV